MNHYVGDYGIPNAGVFCQAHFACLPNPHCQIARSHIPKLPTPHCYFAKLPCPLPKWASSCSQIFKFLCCPRPKCFFQICPHFCPRKAHCPPSAPYFFHMLLRASPPFPFLLSLFIFLKKKTWRVFEDWEEHIQNSNYSLNYFGTYWVQIERFWLQISCFLWIHFCEWSEFEDTPIGWKSIHENSWNPSMAYNL